MRARKKQKIEVNMMNQPCIVVLSDGETWGRNCKVMFLLDDDYRRVNAGKSPSSLKRVGVYSVDLDILIDAYRERLEREGLMVVGRQWCD